MRVSILSLLLVACTCFAVDAVAQDNVHNNAFWNDANGRPLKLNTDFRVEGSPFYYENYCAADIIMASGKKYENIKVKLNVVDNQILFAGPADQELEALSAIKRIRFYNYLSGGTAYDETVIISTKPVINEKGNEIYAVLVDSATKLLRRIKISYTDNKPYNEAVITRTYNRTESLYLLKPGNNQEPIKVQKSKSGMLELLGDKYKQIDAFIERNKMRCKTDKEIAILVAYYNTL